MVKGPDQKAAGVKIKQLKSLLDAGKCYPCLDSTKISQNMRHGVSGPIEIE